MNNYLEKVRAYNDFLKRKEKRQKFYKIIFAIEIVWLIAIPILL